MREAFIPKVINLNSVKVQPLMSEEAEQTLIGCLLLDDGIFPIISEKILSSDVFYIKANKTIYEAMVVLYNRQQKINLLSVQEHLKSSSLLESVGGQDYLALVFESAIGSYLAESALEIILDKYQRRCLLAAANKITALASDCSSDIKEVLELAEDEMYKLANQQIGDRYTVCDAADMALSLMASLDSGKLVGEKIGFTELESITGGIYPGTLNVIGAASSMGKSHFMIALAYEMMTQLNKPVLYISPEMSQEQINIRLLARITGIDSSEIKHNSEKSEECWTKIYSGMEQLSSLPWKVIDHSSPSISIIRSAVKLADMSFKKKDYNGIGCVFIDYLQQLPIENRQGNLAFELGALTREIRAIAKDYNIPIFLGTQINRENETRNDKRPTRADIRNSGEIFEVIDSLYMLYRNSYYTKDSSDRTIEIIVEKNRNGLVGTATMLCDLATSRFVNLTSYDY